MSDEFSWEVIPARGRAAYRGARKPSGSVRVCGGANGDEYLEVPALVARRLSRLQKTRELDPSGRDELLRAMRELSDTCARECVAALIDRREYSSQEVSERLRQEGFSPEVVRRTVEGAKDTGLVSDTRYADSFVRSKVGAGWGMDRIVRELALRGIEATQLEGWPYEYLDPDDERERAREVAMRKHVREPNAYAKLVRFLMGRGFSYGISTSVAREALEG